MASRTTQPYRKGPRVPGQALSNMLRGRTTGGFNPQDIYRASARIKRAAGSGRQRPPRPQRPARPPRP